MGQGGVKGIQKNPLFSKRHCCFGAFISDNLNLRLLVVFHQGGIKVHRTLYNTMFFVKMTKMPYKNSFSFKQEILLPFKFLVVLVNA